ncbi:MAG: chemotaxis protein CheW [Candidatus Methylomirabilia bacterium]
MKPEDVTPAPAPGVGRDWDEIHRRLERTAAALAAGSAPSAEASREVLKARSRALALEPPSNAAAQELLEIVEFSLGAETYGIGAAFVREIFPLQEFTPLPGTPPFVLGIINVRGQILSVVDLKKIFALPEKGLGQLNKVIILRDVRMEFGILADEVLGARAVPKETIQAAPPTVAGIGAEYLLGVTAERVIILDAQRILGYEKLIVHQEAE